jgi:hypothetical protein
MKITVVGIVLVVGVAIVAVLVTYALTAQPCRAQVNGKSVTESGFY